MNTPEHTEKIIAALKERMSRKRHVLKPAKPVIAKDSNIVRCTTAAHRLCVKASTISAWKRKGIISDPGHGYVVFSEAEGHFKELKRTRRGLGHSVPKMSWRKKPDSITRDKAAKTVSFPKMNRHIIHT